jgi:hypothetical protein
MPPVAPEDFVDRRSEMYWALREMFENGEVDIDPLDDKLHAQLVGIKWTVDSKGRRKVERRKR